MQKDNNIKFVSGCLKHIVCTRNENEEADADAYSKGVLEPYSEIKEMYDALVKENTEPTREQMVSALNNLLVTFKTKRVPESEQVERVESLLNDSGTRETMADSWNSLKKYSTVKGEDNICWN
ncbi:MAG TPA: hypothetical protein VHP38_12625 [Ruminiclostridium sp.]|nr:hypothetical protein [Ruminiclostridium sp.]